MKHLFTTLFALIPLSVISQSFITTWQTTNVNESITIPTTGVGYNYSVSWGDGTMQSGLTGDATHTYASPGVYSVSVSGEFPRIYFNNSGDKEKIKSIEQWGNIAWKSMNSAFYGCSALVYHATDVPDLSLVTSTSSMFRGCLAFHGDLSGWDVSNVTFMVSMFESASSFNGNVSTWNVGKVQYMAGLFMGATVFNQDISKWNTENVLTMAYMFWGASAFNQDISGWNTSKVMNTRGMFYEASAFNQNIGNWDMSADTTMAQMFLRATAFNADIGKWNVSSVKNMLYMFYEASSFNQNLNEWDVGSVWNMEGLFYNATAFNGEIGAWDVSNATKMWYMFYGATSFNADISAWNTSSAITMEGMFAGAPTFDQNLNAWDVSSVTNMRFMFSGALAFNGDISSWNVSSVQKMDMMFLGARSFNQDITNWNVSSVTDMNLMFTNAWSFDQDLGGWDIRSVTIMTNMMLASGMSVEAFDQTLIGWVARGSLQNGVNFGGSTLKYCSGESARNVLVTTYGWTVSATKNCGNIAPLRMWLTSSSIEENNELNDLVGTLLITDQNAADSHTYSFVSGAGDMDNGSFILSGNQLRASVLFDFEGKTSYSIRVQSDDGNGGQLAQEFNIEIKNNKDPQIISFEALGEKTFGDPPFDLSAASASGLPVTFISSDETVATVSGHTVTVVGAGNTTITATQAGNDEFTAAIPVERILTVRKANQVVTIQPIEEKNSDDVPFEVIANASSGLPLTYSIQGPATLNGTTITLNGGRGSVTVTASQSGNVNFEAASASVTFEVQKLIVDVERGVEDLLAVYPNPTTGALYIRHAENSIVELVDARGEVIVTRKVAGTESKLDLCDLPAGIYFIRLGSASRSWRVSKY